MPVTIKTSRPMVNGHYAGYDVVGSYVVYDPTGRDLPDSMEVGLVTAVQWTTDDAGDDWGHPRPILTVKPNGDGEEISVTVVFAVLGR